MRWRSSLTEACDLHRFPSRQGDRWVAFGVTHMRNFQQAFSGCRICEISGRHFLGVAKGSVTLTGDRFCRICEIPGVSLVRYFGWRSLLSHMRNMGLVISECHFCVTLVGDLAEISHMRHEGWRSPVVESRQKNARCQLFLVT